MTARPESFRYPAEYLLAWAIAPLMLCGFPLAFSIEEFICGNIILSASIGAIALLCIIVYMPVFLLISTITLSNDAISSYKLGVKTSSVDWDRVSKVRLYIFRKGSGRSNERILISDSINPSWLVNLFGTVVFNSKIERYEALKTAIQMHLMVRGVSIETIEL